VTPPSELDALLALARAAGTDAARHLLEALARDDLDISSKATPTDLVTDVDRAAERIIVERLIGARPNDGVEGEEGTAITGTSGVHWIIDPLDGTTNFVYGHPGFSVSIAAVVDGVPSVGVVFDPLLDECFTARLGGGAHRNGVPIHCSTLDRLSLALVATGFSYDSANRAHQAQVLTSVLPAIRDIRRMGGAAIDLASVGCGRVDAYYERGLQAWDLAAGAIIAAEAGAQVGDLDGAPPSADYCVSAPPALFGPLTELLALADGR
jgi:myo-inositol-1(or 4)-monophosphatase